MAYSRIKLLIEASSKDDEFILLDDFFRELQLFAGALREANRDLIPSGEQTSDFHIVGLSYSSPATITIEARPRDPQNDYSEKTLAYLFGLLGEIQNTGSPSKEVGYGLLSEIRDMTLPVGRTLSHLTIARNGDSVEMGPIFAHRIRELMRPEEIYPTSMRGMLEAINVHKGANIFRLYPDIGPSKITCHFPNVMQEDAISAVGHFVEVSGSFKYKLASPYPYEVLVEQIEIFPEERDLPSLYELRGSAPSATGNLISEVFIRGLRDAAS